MSVEVADHIMVSGNGMKSLLTAFGSFELLAGQIMLQEGIGKERQDGSADFDEAGFYPLKSYLRAIDRMRLDFGAHLVRLGGAAVPRNAVFPPQIVDAHSALASMDVAYHMNHQCNGELMFNPMSGLMQEGIGHYHYQQVGPKNGIMTADSSPYDEDYEAGLMEALVSRFAQGASVIHDSSKPCRRKGGMSCTFHISWK